MMISRLINLFAAASFLVAGCAVKSGENKPVLPYYNSADFTPVWNGDINSFHQIASFAFTDQDGKIISTQSLKNKIHVANFFFTSCSGICPTTQNHFKILQDSFLTDNSVVLISFSVTPETDSVESLQAYAAAHGVNSQKWHLLTGQKDSIYAISRNSYFAEMKEGIGKGADDFLHTEHMILVDKNLHIRGIYNGTLRLEIQRLIEDIRTLENE